MTKSETKSSLRAHEVQEPILNSPYEEPAEHWWIEEGKPALRRKGSRIPARSTLRGAAGTRA